MLITGGHKMQTHRVFHSLLQQRRGQHSKIIGFDFWPEDQCPD
jgi:hypothetical protein